MKLILTSIFLISGLHAIEDSLLSSVPLSSRTGHTSQLFEQVELDSIGITLSKRELPALAKARLSQTDNLDENDTYGGICVGDYDNDGNLDFYITHPFGGHQLYRNLGNFQFEEVAKHAGVHGQDFWARGACFADIDNDHDLDLFVCGNGEPSQLFINQGDGTFDEQAKQFGLDYNDTSTMVAFADYDNDGDLDAYLVVDGLDNDPGFKEDFKQEITFRNGKAIIPEQDVELYDVLLHPTEGPKVIPVGKKDKLFRNEGNGKFTDVSEAAGIVGVGYGLSASWWDYNNDGFIDLYVANDFFTPDQLYRNNGDGTFAEIIAETIPHTPWFSMGTDVGDINNDGLLDFIATDMSGSTHYKSKMGMGDMEKSSWFLTLPTPRQYMRNALYLNTGTERFMEIAKMAGVASTDWTWSSKFGDLDNDGWIDLFFTNGMTFDSNNSDLVNQANQLETREEKNAFWKKHGPKKDRNMAFQNTGDLKFSSVGSSWGLDTLDVSFGAVMADLDNDGDLDIITTNLDSTFKVYRNQSVDAHSITLNLRGTQSNSNGIGAKVTVESDSGQQMRSLNLAQGYESSNGERLHFGLAKNDTIRRVVVQWPSGIEQSFEQLAVNQHYTITEPNSERPVEKLVPELPTPFYEKSNILSDIRHKENDFDDFKVQPLLPNKMSRLGPGMAWSDVDNDGDYDVFICGAKDSASRLLINKGDGVFEKRPNAEFDFFAIQEDMSALFFEFNGDGAPDLYVCAGGADFKTGSAYLHDRLYVNDGQGNFKMAKRETPRILDSGSIVSSADFDRDGDLDLFVGGRLVPGQYPTAPNSHLVINGGGEFQLDDETIAPGLKQTGMVTSALWTDANGDGWLDLMLTHEWGPVKIWLNHEGKLVEQTEEAGLANLLGWWNGITGADFDNDGDMDYVVTNVGLNTKYHASEQQPVIAYYGDMDGSGTRRFVESEFEEGIHYPVRGRSCSANAMPSLREKFPSFDSFAVASLKDIYTPECLQDALRFEANTLESGILINDGQARFEFVPLPRLAQNSPGFGVVATDYNADGKTDIYIVQNSFSPQAETGHMDGGVSLLLEGKGDGTFEPVSPHRSALVVSDDAKALTQVDLNGDGWPDFVCTANDGPVTSFIHQSLLDRKNIVIKLLGSTGNPNAIGAKLKINHLKGASRFYEIYSSHGYLSQSPPLIYHALGADQELQSIEVQWPNGEVTTHLSDLNEAVVSIQQSQ